MKTSAVYWVCAWLTLAAPAMAQSGIPDFSLSTATSNAGHVYIVPDGTGPTLAERDVVITLTLLDETGAAIVNYPFADMWIDDDGNAEILMCNGGSLADGNTNASGIARFSGAFRGGGATQAGLRVYVAGMPLTNGLLAIEVASPDFNRDDRVDIIDLGQYAIDYNDPTYAFWCDFDGNGVEDLADLGIFAAHHGTLGCTP